MPTLSETLSSWRTANQSGAGHSGRMSQLTIDGALYDIQDPALEAMMTAIETRISGIEGANPDASNVTLNSDDFTSITNVEDALKYLKGLFANYALLGTNEDTANTMTLYGVKAYAADLVSNLAGTNWEQNAKKVQEIIAELENSDNANAWATAIDKLAGLNITYTQAEANEHNAGLTGAISTETILTAEQAAALNELAGVSTSSYAEGQQPTAEDAALYNATLEGAWSTSTVKTPRTVVGYVQDYVASQLGNLDAEAIKSVNGVSRAANDQSGAITVYGTDIDLSSSDNTTIAAAIAALQANKANVSDIEENELVTAAALNDLNENKANKAAISTSTINNWSSSYNNGNLTWTSTQATVYVPVSGQTL